MWRLIRFYNLDHLNILYSVVPWNQGVLQKDTLVRFLYAAAALVAAMGASPADVVVSLPASHRDQGSHRLIRRRTFPLCQEPAVLVLFSFDTCIGHVSKSPRLSGYAPCRDDFVGSSRRREELRLEQEYGERFRVYAQGVPRFLPSLSSAVRRRRPVTAMAPSSLGPGLSMGLRRHIACLRVHPKRPNWVCLRSATIAFLVLQSLLKRFGFACGVATLKLRRVSGLSI